MEHVLAQRTNCGLLTRTGLKATFVTVIMVVLIVLGFILLAAGIIGCVLPVIPGPPLIIGTFAGAVLGELIFSNKPDSAIKAGWGVFVGTMLGIALKLAVSGVIAFYVTRAVLTNVPSAVLAG